MKVERVLERLEGPELRATYAHWTGGGSKAPSEEEVIRRRLQARMTDRAIVEQRLSDLPQKLRELLTFIIRGVEWAEPFSLSSIELSGLPLEAFELDACANALVQRGFLCVKRVRRNGPYDDPTYVVPHELGQLLATILQGRRRPLEAALGLGAALRFEERGVLERRLRRFDLAPEVPVAHLIALLSTADAIDKRVERIESEGLRAAIAPLLAHGGILDGEARRRAGVAAAPAELAAWGRELEELLLGCYEEPELADNGIGVQGGWLILYREVVRGRILADRPDPDEAEEDLRRAPDLLADLSGVVREIDAAPLRVKKSGEFYKTAVRKVAKQALTPGYRVDGPEADVLFHLDFLRHAELASVDGDGFMRPTQRWRAWEKRKTVRRMQDLLDYSQQMRVGEISPVHQHGLRKAMIQYMKDAGVGTWCRLAESAWVVRNRYLREAVRSESARRYQERHKHAPFPPLASCDRLHNNLVRWMLEGPARLGFIELAVNERESMPWAWRLTPLGGAALGMEGVEIKGVAGGLVVNPDHEVIVFPENAGYGLVQEVGRFATRVKADFAVHFVLTRESVQAGVAGGMDCDAILEVLTENSRHPIPQNVEFSIREWSGKVTRIESRRSWLIETHDAESLDRLLAVPELSELVGKRLSDTVVELQGDPTGAGVVSRLRELGFYF